jgi:hypothetical protein
VNYYYLVLNIEQAKAEMPEFAHHARRYGAILEYADGNGVRLFRMCESDGQKMPFDQGDPYLGNDSSGHALHLWSEMLCSKFVPNPDWKHCV